MTSIGTPGSNSNHRMCKSVRSDLPNIQTIKQCARIHYLIFSYINFHAFLLVFFISLALDVVVRLMDVATQICTEEKLWLVIS